MFGKSCNPGSNSFNANLKFGRVSLLYNAKKMRLHEFIRPSLFGKPRFRILHNIVSFSSPAIVCTECITNLHIRVIDTDPRTFAPGRRYPTGIFGNKKNKACIKMLCDRCAQVWVNGGGREGWRRGDGVGAVAGWNRHQRPAQNLFIIFVVQFCIVPNCGEIKLLFCRYKSSVVRERDDQWVRAG